MRINIIYNINFPLSFPIFNLLLPLNRIFRIIELFKINQIFNLVLFCKSINNAFFMFPYTFN